MGVDIRAGVAHVCLGRRVGNDLEVLRVGSIPLPEASPQSPERMHERRVVFEDGLADLGISERRAIIALRESDSLDIAHPGPHRIPRTEWESSALVYAKERRPIIPDNETLVARMVVDGPQATIYAAYQSEIDRVVTEASALGLHPVIVDPPQCAWLRVAPTGVIVLYGPGDGYVVAPLESAIHGQHIQPETVASEAATIVTILNTFRTNHGFRGNHISSMLPPGHPLYTRVTSETKIEPLVIDGHVAPAYAFAVGLFLWNETAA
jgi:hypothetical protein